jgi:hypothetical protein
MALELKNVGASVRARLLERARKEGSDFQILLTRYALERLLYRLSLSGERERFILKGAMLFITWLTDPFRPTRDLDLLGQGDPDVDAITSRFRGIFSTDVPDDGVKFDIAGMLVEPIRDQADYGGVRVKTSASIAGAKVPIQIDIGFGDAITPGPIDIDYPALLDAPSPRLRAYPPETVVAEKFEALVSIGITNSRMKDFYDLWMIAQTFQFERQILNTALRRTFERRNTPWPPVDPTGLTDAFALEKDKMWRAFLKRERLGAAPEDMSCVVTDLRAFLGPVIEDNLNYEHWQSGGPWS